MEESKMKPKKFQNKLSLGKQTISSLNSPFMSRLVAGQEEPAPTIVDCDTDECTQLECVVTFQVPCSFYTNVCVNGGPTCNGLPVGTCTNA